MNSAEEIARQVLNELESLATPERREGMSRYFTTSMRCIGVGTPDLRLILRETQNRMKGEPKETVLALARNLTSTRAFEARQLAFEVVARHAVSMRTVTVPEVEELGSGNDNWASVDTFSILLSGALWLRGRFEDETFVGWAESENPWWRRTALVSVVPFNVKSRGGTGDPRRTLLVVDLLKADRHPAVVKAVSWALRSLVAWNPSTVRRYLEENAELLASLVRREVRNKLETGLKNPRPARR